MLHRIFIVFRFPRADQIIGINIHGFFSSVPEDPDLYSMRCDGLSTPSEVMNYAPRPEQLSTRDEAIKAALHYPAGLNAAKTFADVKAPFTADAYRYENGQAMAGPDCKFAPGCQNISTQSLAIFNRLGEVQTRVIAVDERMGIVWLRMAWGVRERGGDQLIVWETFKLYDGKIHAVEAFMRILPVDKRNGGWE